MDIDYYFDKWLTNSAQYCIEYDLQPRIYIEKLINLNDEVIYSIVSFRKNTINPTENFNYVKYSQYFSNLMFEDRIACFAVCSDLEDLTIKKNWRLRCEKYSQNQALFKFEPSLLNFLRKKSTGAIDFELIDSSKFQLINRSSILSFNNKTAFVYLDFAINPALLTWAKENFPKNKLYIKINPHKVFREIPDKNFEFIKIIPANPKWWKKVKIHNKTKEQACYILEDSNDRFDVEKNILRLEVIVSRDNNGNLSMMIEELTKIDSQKMAFGRCIHLDSSDPFGTDFFKVTLNHLDLAINVYEGDNAKNRLENNLAFGGKTENASYRTHLLRIDGIPFKYMLGFAEGFLSSKTLFQEWIEDQFQCSDFSELINTPQY